MHAHICRYQWFLRSKKKKNTAKGQDLQTDQAYESNLSTFAVKNVARGEPQQEDEQGKIMDWVPVACTALCECRKGGGVCAYVG